MLGAEMKRVLLALLFVVTMTFSAFSQSGAKAPVRPQSPQTAPRTNVPANAAGSALVFPPTSAGAPGASAATPVAPRPADSRAAAQGEYVIGPEDVIRMQVWGQETLTTQVPVMPDGKIGLPLVNEVEAAGLTVPQLREKVREKMKEYVVDPTVELWVVELLVHLVISL